MTLLDTPSATALTEEAAAGLDSVIELRRSIHREPELGIDNPNTQNRIAEALDGLPLEIRRGEGEITSLVADLKGGDGPTVLLRADTDALPMTEDNDHEFASTIPGRAHMCGHDSHVAMLVGAARILCARRDEIQGTIRFMFQPGEEGYAGAKLMIEEGVLDGVDAAYALHVTPNAKVGTVQSRSGPMLASADTFTITVAGRGGHASTPHLTTDPVPIAAHIITALQTMVTREIHAFEPAIVSVTKVTAGTTSNVIPAQAELVGTIRCVSARTRSQVHATLDRVARSVALTHDASAEVVIELGYPVTVNDAGAVEVVADVTRSLLGDDAFVEVPHPRMGAEDFSYVLEQVPGAMSMLGVCPADIESPAKAPACHSNLMRIHEPAMANGVAVHVGTALAAIRQLRTA